MFPPNGGNELSLAEFAPAGAKKMGSFLPATCASAKILLAERSVDRPAKRDDEARSGVQSPSFGWLRHPNEAKLLKREPSAAGLV